MSRTDKPMVISKSQIREMRVHGAGKSLTPVGGVIRPKKGGGYKRAGDKQRTRREEW